MSLGGFTLSQQTGLMADPAGNMTCSLSPLQYQCLYFGRHICYCLILKKKVAEQRIMKSKPGAHSREAPGKKRTVSILISLTESRNMASVTHHLPPLLSLCGGEGKKKGEEVV